MKIYQIEACLNSRPIAPLTNDPTEVLALTPEHFQILRPLNANPEPDKRDLKYSSRWKLLTEMLQGFRIAKT